MNIKKVLQELGKLHPGPHHVRVINEDLVCTVFVGRVACDVVLNNDDDETREHYLAEQIMACVNQSIKLDDIERGAHRQ